MWSIYNDLLNKGKKFKSSKFKLFLIFTVYGLLIFMNITHSYFKYFNINFCVLNEFINYLGIVYHITSIRRGSLYCGFCYFVVFAYILKIFKKDHKFYISYPHYSVLKMSYGQIFFDFHVRVAFFYPAYITRNFYFIDKLKFSKGEKIKKYCFLLSISLIFVLILLGPISYFIFMNIMLQSLLDKNSNIEDYEYRFYLNYKDFGERIFTTIFLYPICSMECIDGIFYFTPIDGEFL